MEIVVVGRHTEIPDRFRKHIEDKLGKIEQLDQSATRVDVLCSHESNRRQADSADRVEITVHGAGAVVRAEASAGDRYGALDVAAGKLFERLRRAKERRADRFKGDRERIAQLPVSEDNAVVPPAEDTKPAVPRPQAPGEVGEVVLGDSPVVIREKVHSAAPMPVERALYEMELVGHPFYLFVDAETSQPAVIYRRRGWSYGVIRLQTAPAPEPAGAAAGA